MNWCEVLTIIGANIAVIFPLFLWLRSEANADRREASADRRDIMQLIREIQNEMKDFHGRLCSIETKRELKTDP